MIPALVLAFWKQRLMSPMRMALLALMFGLPLLVILAMPAAVMQVLGQSPPFAMLLAAGMIGQDVSSGVLQLVFARPVRRWEYVTSRWLAAAIAAAGIAVLQVLVAWLILLARAAHPDAAELAQLAGARVFETFGLAAVMALFSSLIAGLGDLALYVILNVLGSAIGGAGQWKGWPVVTRIGEELQGFLAPKLDLAALATGSAPGWFAAIAYLSTIALCIVLAVVVVNRKELSYASG